MRLEFTGNNMMFTPLKDHSGDEYGTLTREGEFWILRTPIFRDTKFRSIMAAKTFCEALWSEYFCMKTLDHVFPSDGDTSAG